MTERTRIQALVAVVAIAAIVVLTWFLGVQPQIAAVASTNAEHAAADALNAEQEAVLAQLEADAEHEADLRTEYDAASLSVPAGTGVPAYIDQLNELAGRTGVTITRLTVSDPIAFVPAAAAPTDAAGATDPATTAEPAAVDPGAPADLGPGNFAYLEVGMDVEGQYDQVLAFTEGLQHGGRLTLVHKIDLSKIVPGEGEPVDPVRFSGTLNGFVYSLAIADAAEPVEG
ncbi:hypothetical protein [Agromyces seonyuensis]|uniref:Type 4a pilus biogenesis protein PilO n=1 Tax=Agromyces seonyuensis TaxID=2662446 RepID=A0A6I4P3Y2_9MICO|nr:hypothetical protein [Agromyces seonyuensis]MWB99595.1 hypothetical protein [Agromyces seonyuensis]